jgi:hypothetical protein
MAEQEVPAEGYDGPAALAPVIEVRAPATEPVVEVRAPASLEPTDDEGIRVEVRLRGHFEPLDGRFHWYGRVSAGEDLTTRYPSGSTVVISTPHGRAEGRLSDVDPWGRLRISGTGRPPY